MVTEIKDEDQEHDHQPVNAATEIPRDHKKQSSMNAATEKYLSNHNNMPEA
jgi:hypothetical protein